MATTAFVRGSIPEIIGNVGELYEGTLTAYFRIVFFKARNLRAGYHNFRHLMHVLYMCCQACIFYKEQLTPRQMRNLLIAAMFHDFDHSGSQEKDSLQIEKAVAGFRRHVLPEDIEFLEEIVLLIQYTEYPYTVQSSDIPLEAQILRDADLSQALSLAWLQQVVFGLSEEWKKSPLEVLRMQVKFHSSLKLVTEWAQTLFPQSVINDKIAEAQELIALLEGSDE